MWRGSEREPQLGATGGECQRANSRTLASPRQPGALSAQRRLPGRLPIRQAGGSPQTRSISAAIPCPTPMHIVAIARFLP